VGKSTQIKLLEGKLLDLGVKVRSTREPGGTETGEKIRSILKSSHDLDPMCELMLIFAARRDHFVKLMAPLINQGYVVICDRFYDSSLVYQGLLKGVPVEDIMKLKQMTLGEFDPDLTIILDADSQVSIQRVKHRNLLCDEYDLMTRQKHDLIRDGFLKISEIFSFRSVLINAEGSERKVFSRVWKAFEKKIQL